MRVAFGVNQLGVNTDLAARSTDASFQHVADPELPADPPGVDGLASIGERGVAGNHEHAYEPRQIGR